MAASPTRLLLWARLCAELLKLPAFQGQGAGFIPFCRPGCRAFPLGLDAPETRARLGLLGTPPPHGTPPPSPPGNLHLTHKFCVRNKPKTGRFCGLLEKSPNQTCPLKSPPFLLLGLLHPTAVWTLVPGASEGTQPAWKVATTMCPRQKGGPDPR